VKRHTKSTPRGCGSSSDLRISRFAIDIHRPTVNEGSQPVSHANGTRDDDLPEGATSATDW
jgi:hypothetical protein